MYVVFWCMVSFTYNVVKLHPRFVACVSNSFLIRDEQHSLPRYTLYFSICQWTSMLLYPLNILNRATFVNICVQVLVWVSVFNSVKCSTGLKKDGEELSKELLEDLGWMYFHMLLILLVFLFNFSTLHSQNLERPLA